jgi:hypothetical protein
MNNLIQHFNILAMCVMSYVLIRMSHISLIKCILSAVLSTVDSLLVEHIKILLVYYCTIIQFVPSIDRLIGLIVFKVEGINIMIQPQKHN